MLAQITKNQLAIRGNTQLVQGTVGETLQLAFSEEWSELTVTAVFAAGERKRDVVVSGAELTIPWELLSEAGRRLSLSFHGAAENGSIVLRTNIASLGVIRRSLEPSGEAPEAPTPARADQIQAIAGQAMALAAAVRAEADSGAFDGADGVSPAIAVTEVEGGHRVTIIDAEGTRSFVVPDGTGGAGGVSSVNGQTGDVLLPIPAAVTVDSALSDSSANPAQNRVLKSALDSKAAASDLAAKADKVTEVTVSTAGAVTQALDPEKIYHFTGALTALTITLNTPASGQLAHYHFDFDSGSTAPTLTLPQAVTMPGGFTVEASRHYEIDILNGYGAVMAW